MKCAIIFPGMHFDGTLQLLGSIIEYWKTAPVMGQGGPRRTKVEIMAEPTIGDPLGRE